MGKTIHITEKQLTMLSSMLIENVVGYDDFYTMMLHSGKSLHILKETLYDLNDILKGIINMSKLGDIDYLTLRENLLLAVKLINSVDNIIKVVFEDFTDSIVIKTGKVMLKQLRQYQNKIRMFLTMGEDLMSKESLLLKLSEITHWMGKYIYDYMLSLKNFELVFVDRITKNRDQRKSDLN